MLDPGRRVGASMTGISQAGRDEYSALHDHNMHCAIRNALLLWLGPDQEAVMKSH
jgi:hypothetical protein